VRNFDKKNLFCILLGILILSSIRLEVHAQSTLKVEIKTLSDIDVCGNKLFQIYIQTDEIYAADSIVGFDLYLGFNEKKIQLDQMLASGTLSAPLQNSGSDAVLTMNKTVAGEVWISGAFFTNNKFLKGKQPLIALSGRYLNDCSDTTVVNLIEFIPAYYDFSKLPPIIAGKNLLLIANIAKNSGKKFETTIKKDKVTLTKEDSVGQIAIYLNNEDIVKTKNVELALIIDKKDILSIRNIESVQTGLTVDTSYIKNDNLIIGVSWKDSINVNLPAFTLQILRKKYNNDTVKIFVNVIKLTSCNCVNTVSTDSVQVELEGIIVGVNIKNNLDDSDNEVMRINEWEGSLILTCEEGNISQILLYDVIGEVQWSKKYFEQTVIVPKELFSNGVSILEVMHVNQNKETKKLIKYIK